ncbi:hypothetical protein IHE45_04G078100 [Dioscorea alata]|uniref:Uncharacterized protein n=1 Tax=Dioscorea alata TaxID=55571 RepID=A0ACB7WEA5_DIOAL|nr:hypothetical protein IHE45_04G078100 [Dioscorea alata]
MAATAASSLVVVNMIERAHQTYRQEQHDEALGLQSSLRPFTFHAAVASVSSPIVLSPARFRLDNFGPWPGSRKRNNWKGGGGGGGGSLPSRGIAAGLGCVARSRGPALVFIRVLKVSFTCLGFSMF